MKKAFITGISGQDGSFLAEFLIEKGYDVHGLVQRIELEDPERKLWRINHIRDKVTLHPGSIESLPSLLNTVERILPDECYHLAAASFVSYSFDDELPIFNVNVNGTHNILVSIKKFQPKCKFYFAASSEMFGNADVSPQDETCRFHPRSIYGITKVTGYFLTQYYREHYDIFACNGILYNHESERRGVEYVTRKITSRVVKIKLGLASELRLGNLDAQRDWGYAPDYVRAMWLMLQQPIPDDYIVATGQPHSVREFVDKAFQEVGLNWEEYVVEDPKFYRPVEEKTLTGDARKARKILDWKPETDFEKLIKIMVRKDLQSLSYNCT